MSQITADHAHGHGHHEPGYIEARRHIDMNAVTLKGGKGVSGLLIIIGIAAIAFTAFGGFSTGGMDEAAAKAAKTHALAAYHMGFLYVMGLALGCLGLQMILQQFNAGWSGTIRRHAEIAASLMWVVLLLFIPIAYIDICVLHGGLFSWMNPAKTAGDPIYAAKAGFLNVKFFLVRAAVYFTIWILLAGTLYRLSRRQDETGDKWITARQRFISSFGLLLFALTTAFAAFDWLMSLDYHFFSTMLGVYFFAGSIVSTIAMLGIIMTTLRLKGKYGAAFTEEHQHDLGKLQFAFIVFWAYITFCQYFLIWYSNIPEETAFYNLRKDGGYMNIFTILAWGHFVLPFLILVMRPIKRNAHTFRLLALWIMVMHGVDLFFMVRPVVKSVKIGENWWLDVLGIIGPVFLFLGLVVWKMGKAPLVPIKDPRLDEILHHKNYV